MGKYDYFIEALSDGKNYFTNAECTPIEYLDKYLRLTLKVPNWETIAIFKIKLK